MNHTHTSARLWDPEMVDRLFGELVRELESDYLRRQSYIEPTDRNVMEKQLQAINANWTWLLRQGSANG